MKAVAAIAIACLAVAQSAMAQTMYQWKDPASGRMIYSDQPPPAGVRASSQKGGGEARDERQPSYATKLAAEKYPVVLYTAADCLEPCANARGLLNGRGVPFAEKLVQGTPESLAELKALSGGDPIVPLVVVGTQNFKGFDAAAWNNLLDLAGYPKSAPYGSKPSGAFAK